MLNQVNFQDLHVSESLSVCVQIILKFHTIKALFKTDQSIPPCKNYIDDTGQNGHQLQSIMVQ